MDNKSNGLTPAQVERLALLSEELGEVQQIIGKILRHGYESCNPFDSTKTSNRELLEKELGDISAAFEIMSNAEDLDEDNVHKACDEKLEKVKKWLHHN